MVSKHRRLGGSAHWLVHADLKHCWFYILSSSCHLCRDEELLHGHHVHGGKVLDHYPLALLLVVVVVACEQRSSLVFEQNPLTEAKVLLEVDDVLGDHDRVLDVRLHPLQTLDALVASVPATVSQQWTNFLNTIFTKCF